MPKSKNKRRKKNNGLAAVLIVLVVCAGLVLGGIFFYNGQLKPAASESEQITFTVSQGESLNRVIKNLEDQGVIRSGWAAKISVNLSGDNAEVAVAPGRLRELLTNLMENGIKYNEPGGRVDVQAAQRDGKVAITVSDTGIGIPKESRERVFERFYRVDKGRARKTGGTGLGLSIVKHIVLHYGGSISLKSEPGKGTEITVLFPAVR